MPQRVLRDRLIELEVPSDDVARGRAMRKASPRRALAHLNPSARSAAEILTAQNADRLRELVPLRFARMLSNALCMSWSLLRIAAATRSHWACCAGVIFNSVCRKAMRPSI